MELNYKEIRETTFRALLENEGNRELYNDIMDSIYLIAESGGTTCYVSSESIGERYETLIKMIRLTGFKVTTEQTEMGEKATIEWGE